MAAQLADKLGVSTKCQQRRAASMADLLPDLSLLHLHAHTTPAPAATDMHVTHFRTDNVQKLTDDDVGTIVERMQEVVALADGAPREDREGLLILSREQIPRLLEMYKYRDRVYRYVIQWDENNVTWGHLDDPERSDEDEPQGPTAFEQRMLDLNARNRVIAAFSKMGFEGPIHTGNAGMTAMGFPANKPWISHRTPWAQSLVLSLKKRDYEPPDPDEDGDGFVPVRNGSPSQLSPRAREAHRILRGDAPYEYYTGPPVESEQDRARRAAARQRRDNETNEERDLRIENEEFFSQAPGGGESESESESESERES
jgi:hypothetical protein